MSLPASQSYAIRFEREDCCSCGTVFFVTDDFQQRAIKTGKNFFCPNGHQLVYNDNENARLKKQLIEQTKAATQMAERAKLAEEAEQRAVALAARIEGDLKRAKKRAAAGACPCCQRTVSQMARHIKAKHPAYVAEGIK